MERFVYIGWEPREADAFAVARHSIERHASSPVAIKGLVLSKLQAAGLYTRPHHVKDNRLWDPISDAPMATQFANSRFLVPHLARQASRSQTGARWALFIDCDMMFRVDVHRLFFSCDQEKAVMVVKHDHRPRNQVKMDGQIQTAYTRKNWSSVCAFNLDHPSNDLLTPELVNEAPGRELHAFCWLRDDEIGALDPGWNYLVGNSAPHPAPMNVHFTDGIPSMPGYGDCEFASEWRTELELWAAR